MITFVLLFVFALIAIFFTIIAFSANNRRRAGMKGVDPARSNGPRAMHR